MKLEAVVNNEQIDLFFEKPEITGLGIVEFKIVNGQVKGTLLGATNTPDIAKLDDYCWKSAVAEWLIVLCEGNRDEAYKLMGIAKDRLLSAEDREMVTLPNDVARCAGVGDDEDGWREGCEDCARRLAESTSDVSAWMMMPPAIIVFGCEFRIATNVELTGQQQREKDYEK